MVRIKLEKAYKDPKDIQAEVRQGSVLRSVLCAGIT